MSASPFSSLIVMITQTMTTTVATTTMTCLALESSLGIPNKSIQSLTRTGSRVQSGRLA